MLPPKEKRHPGILWKLKKPVYGLSDASRGFHLSLSGKMTDLGCVQNPHDPALFLCFPNETDKNAVAKKPIGLAVSHVDDLLHTGTGFQLAFFPKVLYRLNFQFFKIENFAQTPPIITFYCIFKLQFFLNDRFYNF